MNQDRIPVDQSNNDSDVILASADDQAALAAQKAALEKRVRALEAVVNTERKLRKVQDEVTAELRKRLEMVDTAISHAAQATDSLAAVASHDDDATVLAPAADNDATRIVPRAQAMPLVPADAATPIAPPAARTPPPLAAPKENLALPVGFNLFEYRIDSVLGQGGFGITYLATDVHLNVKVAIKEYLPGDFAQRASDKSVTPRWPEDREFYQHGLDSFLVEARTLATFRHSNIVRVARFFEAHRTAYMVLEYERGRALKAWWPTHNDLPEQELLTLLQPLLDGLGLVHESGYLHRDIKPDNIYVRREDGSLVLLDFGAARQTVGDPQEVANVITPGYAPIEQYKGGEQGPWTDIYALGATLYWMITGKKPPAAVDRSNTLDPMVPAEEAGKGRYSVEFLRAVDWALKIDAKDRPQDVQEFRRHLFAGHVATLGLQEALRVGDAESAGGESWRMLLDSPRLLKARLVRFGRAVARPASWPMVVKMTTALVFSALVPMLITANYNLTGSIESLSSAEIRNLEQLAQSSAGRVSQLINDSRNLANYLGTDPEFVSFLQQPTDAAKASIQAKIHNLVKSNPDVYPLFLMNPEGTAVASSDDGVMGKNFKFREYFKEAMQGRPHMTGMVVGSTAGAPGIYYSNPVRDADRNVIGVVVLRIKGTTVASILGEITRGTRLTPFLVDGDGVMIYHPDQTQLYRSLTPLPSEKLKQIVADQRFRRNKIDTLNMPDLASAIVGAKSIGNVSYHSTLSGTTEVAGYAPVIGHNWVVAVSESRQAFEQPLNQLFTNVMYSVILVGLVFFVFAVMFARSIVRPIESLTVAAHALKSGDYEKANIKVTSDDEIGKLARTFNVMIDVLRQRDREHKRRQPAKRNPLGLPDDGS